MSRPRTPSTQSVSTEQVVSLLYLLQVEQGHGVRDLDFVLRQGPGYDAASQSHGAMVLEHPNFRRWIVAEQSDLVYVESRLDSSRFGRTSPISYFCANLLQHFKNQAATSTIYFFCGQHEASNDDLKGPRGLVRSLLAQLLQRWPNVPTDPANLDPFNGEHEKVPTEELCRLFEQVLGQVPGHVTITCIIDGIAHFEKDNWKEDYWAVVTMLSNAVLDQNLVARFKVLMTGPIRSMWLQGQVPEAWRIEVGGSGRAMDDRWQRSRWEDVKEFR